jgi:hypothetical protein
MNPPNSEPRREVLTANHAKDANGFNAKDFDTLRQLPILETRAENILPSRSPTKLRARCRSV